MNTKENITLVENNNIKSSDIENNNIKSSDIENNNIKSSDIENNNIKSSDIENNNIKSSDIEIAEKLNAFFSNIVKELNIKVKEYLLCDVSDINDPVERASQKYKNHPSIQMIKETFDSNNIFSFDLISSDAIFKEILSPDTKKKLRTVMM